MEEEHVVMRATAFVVTLLLGLGGPAAAQEWTEYQNNQDGFKVNFVGQPKITNSTWTTAQGYVLPARVYSADTGSGRYSMTVVDYSVIDRLGMERSVKCPIGAETCQGQPTGNNRAMLGPGYATAEIRDALIHATFKYLQRDAKVTDYLWNNEDLVEGHELHLTNADQSRTSVFIAMHENKLYIVDATVPKGYPEPKLFTGSLGFVDKDGRGIRYQAIYSNEFHGLRVYPVPPLAGGGQGGPPPAAPTAPGR
jgi:hypothetical protein